VPALGQPEARPITLGRYELVAPIGRGGMAEVHLAIQRGSAGFEKLVVIKLVHEHLASQPAFVDMLLDEGRLAGMIKHPNVVEIYELGEDVGRHFIAMEYLDGEPLLEVLSAGRERRARLDPLSIARVIADTAEGLDAAHRLKSRDGEPIGLVHHDVSLGNIVVLYSGLVKLVDFGVAKAQHASRGERVQGKLGYMAPEKVQDRAVDRRSDIWSLGCVLWEALTQRRLFKGDSDADTVRQVLGAEIAPPSEVDPSARPELDPIVMRALQRDPNRRYQTAKGMAADLEEVLRELGYGASNDRIAAYMEAEFAARIAARERVMTEISNKRRPSAATLEAAFGEAVMPAARTISSTGDAPVAVTELAEALDMTELIAPAPPGAAPAEPATALTAAAPITPDDPLLLDPVVPAPPRLPPAAAPWRADEPNPFADDDDSKTIADMIPANAEASRSLQSEPSWTVARESVSLGELQRWVQETRTPPRSRREALVRKVRPLHLRVTAWAVRQRLPRWSPYAAAATVLLWLVLFVAMCTGK